MRLELAFVFVNIKKKKKKKKEVEEEVICCPSAGRDILTQSNYNFVEASP